MNSPVTPGSRRAWWLAARPKTLTAALLPVIAAGVLAHASAGAEIAVGLHAYAGAALALCVLFAALMQIASNFINDLIDFRRGDDGEARLGPERACAQGWIAPHAMARGIGTVLALAAGVGLALLALLFSVLPMEHTRLALLLVGTGASCMAGAFLYTTHLSRMALGDVLVFVFFGFVPLCGTFFAMTGTVTPAALWLSLGVGAMADTLLVVNNVRDIDNDRRVGKRTLIVLIGRRAGIILYGTLGLLAAACTLSVAISLHLDDRPALFALFPGVLCVLFATQHLRATFVFAHMPPGRALNAMLGTTSANMLRFLLVTALCIGWN